MKALSPLRLCHAALFVLISVAAHPNVASAQSTCASRKDLPNTLIDAETALRSADDDLERARQGMADAQEEVERATRATVGTTIAEATAKLEQATKAWEDAVLNDKAALERHDCVERRLMEARTWRYAFLAGVHGAIDASDNEKWGGQVAFVWHPYRLDYLREFEGVLRWSRQNTNGSERDWMESILRWGVPFGSAGTLSFGPGLALAPKKIEHLPRIAITGDLGFGMRFGQWLRGAKTNDTGIAGARIFMQPWFMANAPTSVLFGIELTIGYGRSRIGNPEDLKYGKDVPLGDER